MADAAETILVVETGRLGDLVMVTPALQALRRGAPEARIVVAGGWPLEILRHLSCVDHLVPVAHPNPRWLRLLLERRRWRRWIAEQRCRAILLCHGHDHRVWEWAARRAGVRLILSERLANLTGGHHSERLHRLATEIVGRDGPAPPCRIVVTDAERAAAERRLAALGRDAARRLLGVHVGTHRLSRGRDDLSRKMWPVDRWKALLPDLVQTWNVQVLFTGTAAEAAAVAEVASVLPAGAAIDLCGRTGVRDLAATIALCDLFITPDTGPMHVAAALDVPLVAMFSVTRAADIGPRGPHGRHTILGSAAPCLPCDRRMQSRCRQSRCTDDLTVDRVRAAAEAHLAGAPQSA